MLSTFNLRNPDLHASTLTWRQQTAGSDQVISRVFASLKRWLKQHPPEGNSGSSYYFSREESCVVRYRWKYTDKARTNCTVTPTYFGIGTQAERDNWN